MLRRSKILAGILAVVFAAAVLPIAGWASATGHVEHAAGCHSDMPSSPAPAEPSHQCCATGHQWAVPGSPVILQPIAQVGLHKIAHDLRAFLFNDRALAFVSDSPPVHTSLRI